MESISLALGSRQDISIKDLLKLAKEADDLGYTGCFVGESWGMDAFTTLSAIASCTKNICVGTGIVPIFSRTPSLLAQSIASLDIISGGRAILGLGTSGRRVIENWHGIKYERPIERSKEYLEIIRIALNNSLVNYNGNFFQTKRFKLAISPVQKNIPLYLASIGPSNLKLTGQLADGWLPIWTDLEKLPDLIGQISDSAKSAGRNISDITISPQIMCCVTNTTKELYKAQNDVREHISYYIGGMGEYYHDLFCRFGYQLEANSIKNAWMNGNRKMAASLVTSQMLDNITVIGDPESCRSKIERFRQMGADMPVIAFHHRATPDSIMNTIRALAPVDTN